jgi:hypothetical protein
MSLDSFPPAPIAIGTPAARKIAGREALPVSDKDVVEILGQILSEIRELKEMLT